MAANTLLCTTQWSVDVTTEDGAFGGSCTAGWTQRIDGRHDVTATVDSMLLGSLAFEPPDAGAAHDLLSLYFTTTGPDYWKFTALCTGWTITADVSSGTEITIQRRFGACRTSVDASHLTLSAVLAAGAVGPLASTGGKVIWST